jgi:hypothetical protein
VIKPKTQTQPAQKAQWYDATNCRRSL